MAEKRTTVNVSKCNTGTIKTCTINKILCWVGVAVIVIGLIIFFTQSAWVIFGPVFIVLVSTVGWIGMIVAIVGAIMLLMGLFYPFGKEK